MGIQKEPHQRLSKALAIARGSGASKFFEIRIRPLSKPGRRGRVGAAKGMSRARGRPARAMTISSPFAARSTSREKWVLAS
jgi:hypothetical protein